MERITHTSSIASPSFGKISLISMPLLPQRRKLKGEPSRLPVLRSVFRLPLGIGLPLYFCSIGLGSKVSTCGGPAVEKKEDDVFRRRLEVRRLGGHGRSRDGMSLVPADALTIPGESGHAEAGPYGAEYLPSRWRKYHGLMFS